MAAADYNFYNNDLATSLLDFLEGDDPRGFIAKAQERLSELESIPKLLRPARTVLEAAERAAWRAATSVARKLSLGALEEAEGVQDVGTGLVFLSFGLTVGRFSGERIDVHMLEVKPNQYWGTISFPFETDDKSPAVGALFALITVPPEDPQGLSAFLPPLIDC